MLTKLILTIVLLGGALFLVSRLKGWSIIAAVLCVIAWICLGGIPFVFHLISIAFHWCVKHWVWVGVGIVVIVILDAFFSEGVGDEPIVKKDKYHTKTRYVVDGKEFDDQASAMLYARQFHPNNPGSFVSFKTISEKDK